MKELADAVNRVADALFKCATEQKRQTRLQERAVSVAEANFELQVAHVKTTAALEAALTEQTRARSAS